MEEQAIATRGRNEDSIGIEVCHPDAEGEFNDITYQSVIKLTAELCKQYGLNENDVIRHYDVTGKICPRYYVEHYCYIAKDSIKYYTRQMISGK